MALSEDQKAMLRLLAQREQGYGDIAALMGIGVDDVRAKVKAALAGLDQGLSQDQKAMLRLQAQREEGYGDIAALMGIGVDEVRVKVGDALAGLDGEAGPVAKAPDPPPPAPEPPPPSEPKEQPEPAKESPKPAKAKPAPSKPAASKPAAKKSAASSGPKLPEDKGALRALVAGGAVVVVIVLLLVTGVLGGGDDGGSDTTTADTTGAETTSSGETGSPAKAGQEPTKAVLSAVDGSDASGQALFGRSGQSVVLLLGAKGLPPTPKGQSYTVSLVRSPTQRLPLVAAEATKSGVISGRFKVAAQVLGLLAGGFDEMEISLVGNDDLRVALAQARKEQKAPNYEGTTVLAGPVTGPIVDAAAE